MMQKELITKRPVAAIGEEIGYELGAQLVTNYQVANPNDTQFYTIGKNIIEQILSQPGCEGIRFYNAYNEEGEKTLVYLGVDASGNPIKEYTLVDANGQISTRPAIIADRAGSGKGGSWWDIFKIW
jgi:hypothetical protein